ncbi:MAG: hypothetical protein ACPGRX_09190 [Bdellovibrionales bacterium]
MMIWVVLSFLPFAFGLYLCGEFVYRLAVFTQVEGEVSGFHEETDKGRALPVVKITHDDGSVHQIFVRRIDEIFYLLNPPIVGEVKTVLYRPDRPKDAVIYGYAHVTAGAVLCLPFLIALGVALSKAVFVTQLLYLLIFTGIGLGGFAALKLIQRYG